MSGEVQALEAFMGGLRHRLLEPISALNYNGSTLLYMNAGSSSNMITPLLRVPFLRRRGGIFKLNLKHVIRNLCQGLGPARLHKEFRTGFKKSDHTLKPASSHPFPPPPPCFMPAPDHETKPNTSSGLHPNPCFCHPNLPVRRFQPSEKSGSLTPQVSPAQIRLIKTFFPGKPSSLRLLHGTLTGSLALVTP